ncbi:MAG: sensor domain-containing diguanylate cyclase [Chromatiales bacterium]|nr:sensor domain-containing diguanylate cyclase [Chromatiales bacterium]
MLDRQLASTQTLQLAGLHTLDMFYTPLEARFDRLTRLARVALSVPAAGITLFGENRVWFKSVSGWDVQELETGNSFCHLLGGAEDLLVVEDTRLDRRLRDHPLVEAAPRFRFYAGYPLRDRQHNVIGSLCVFDTKPRALGPFPMQALRDLGELAQREILVNEARDAHAQLVDKLDIARRQAMIDVLTRIWNRRAGLQFLEKAIEQASRERAALSICVLDCDHFKQINDRYGHPTGDKMLRKVAAGIVGNMRDSDLVCRLGGDEFMVIMRETDAPTARQAVSRLQDRLGEFPLRIDRSTSIPVEASAGTATLFPGQKMTASALIAIADRALLDQKAKRRSGGDTAAA